MLVIILVCISMYLNVSQCMTAYFYLSLSIVYQTQKKLNYSSLHTLYLDGLLTSIMTTIEQLIQETNYIDYDSLKLITLVNQFNGISIIFFVDALDKQTIYSNKDGIKLFYKIWKVKSQFRLQQVPQSLIRLYRAIGYYYNVVTKVPTHSFEAAEYGSNFSFKRVSIISDLCIQYAQLLFKYGDNKKSRATKQFAINILKNWNKNNNLNQLSILDQELFYIFMANLLYQMSFEYAIKKDSNKVIMFCKQASSYIKLSNWNPSQCNIDADLIKYNQLSKFNSLSTIELIHLNEFEMGSAFQLTYKKIHEET